MGSRSVSDRPAPSCRLALSVVTAGRSNAAGKLERLFAPLPGSCPIYLSPATTRTKSIRLHQVWQPKPTRGVPVDDEEEDEQPLRSAARSFLDDIRGDAPPESPSPARIPLYPHDPYSGEEIEREEVLKGYEYERGRFVTFTAAELKALDVESSKIIDLETFAPRAQGYECPSAR